MYVCLSLSRSGCLNSLLACLLAWLPACPQDGLYDCRWSESNENVLVSASGDGSIKVWDVALPPEANPIFSCEEHQHEVYSLSWNPNQRSVFLSGSWDDAIKLWNQEHLPRSVQTFTGHTYCVYTVEWSPMHAEVAMFGPAMQLCGVFDGAVSLRSRSPRPGLLQRERRLHRPHLGRPAAARQRPRLSRTQPGGAIVLVEQVR